MGIKLDMFISTIVKFRFLLDLSILSVKILIYDDIFEKMLLVEVKQYGSYLNDFALFIYNLYKLNITEQTLLE